MNNRFKQIQLKDFVVSVPEDLRLVEVPFSFNEKILMLFYRVVALIFASKKKQTWFSKRYEAVMGNDVFQVAGQTGQDGVEDLHLTWDCDQSQISAFEIAGLAGKRVTTSGKEEYLLGWFLSKNHSSINFSLHGKSAPSESAKQIVQNVIESTRYVGAAG